MKNQNNLAVALIIIIITLALLILTKPAFAASEHRGVVRFNDLPVPGVSATAMQGEKKFTVVTNSQGIYLFPNLTDGVWIIQIEMFGFQTMKREAVIGSEKSELEWELTMLPLSEMRTEQIKTMATGPVPEFQRTDLKQLAEESDTPSNSEAGGTPVARTPAAGTPTLPASAETSSPFAGLSSEQLSDRAADGFLINGSTNNAAASPFAQMAAFGNNRRFRGLYNGSVNVFLNNSGLDARSYSLTGQDMRKPDYHRSRFALNFGGPLNIPHLIKNGPWFFLGYERNRDRNATIHTSRMPTPEERSGDLSQARNPLGQAVQIFDPETGLPFENNIIPQYRLSPQAQSLLSLYPMPNSPYDGRYNYQIPIVAESHQDAVQGRISQGRFSSSFNYQNTRTDNPNAFAFLDTGRTTLFNLGTNYYRSLGRRFSMNLQYQFERTTRRTAPYFANRANISGDIGILGNNQEPRNWGPPNLSFSNYAGLADGQDSYNRDLAHIAAASITLGRGEHNFRIGMNFRRQQLNELSQQDARGTFLFTGAAAGYDFASFLLGIPDASSIAFGNADKYFRASSYSVYANDDWRISSAFTLNYGVRWEYEAPVTELYERLVNLDIAPDFSAAIPTLASHPTGTLTGRKYPNSLVNPDKRGILPRIGFAWRPAAASSLVIRGGYGISRDTSVYLPIAKQMAQQSPLSKSMSISNSPDTPLTLANGFNSTPQEVANTYAIDPHYRVAIAQTWQLSVQRDLPFSMQIVGMYLGIKGSRVGQKFYPNTNPLGSVNLCTECPSGFVYTTSRGSSIRHAGQVQLRRRLGNGFSANIDYTFSKSLDDAGLGGSGIAQNWLDLKAERALSSFDQRHLMKIQAQYTSGAGVFGSNVMSGWRGAFLKEWTFAGLMTISSGMPLTPGYSAVVPGTGNTGSMRPSLTGASVTDAPEGLYLNPAAYQPPAAGEWGNAGRNSITGPKQFSLNTSLSRAFRLRDRYNLEFRLEANNILNHVTFPSWNTIINSSQFGLPDRANPMRKVQANLRMSF
jgi:hypothetical protein